MFDWSQVVSMKEAAGLYARDTSTIKRAISNGTFIEGVDCKKFGRDWGLLKESLDRVYITDRKNRKK